MGRNTQSSSKEREQRLIEKIEKAKNDLAKIQDRRKAEIGAIAFKHALDHFDNEVLDPAFKRLAKELSGEHGSEA